MTSCFSLLRAACLWLALLLAANPAHAHDPFDGNAQMLVFDDRLELTVTLGADAAKLFLASLDLPRAEVAKMTRVASGDQLLALPLAAAPRLMQVDAGAHALSASYFALAPNDDDIAFRIIYPRPPGETVVLHAGYLGLSNYMKAGTVLAADHNHKMLASALLSRAKPSVSVPLTLRAAAAAKPGFGAMFVLGVFHILTGFDHLLFLCALLINIRAFKPMLAIVTAFTVTHSITLALSAFELVRIPAQLTEALIAASIIVAGVTNLLRREAGAGQVWMAAAFGLLHGFGFAAALRATGIVQPGGDIVVPLLAFNLGVEGGQLLVAALVIPLLLLARRQARFARYGAPLLSMLVIAISSVWLVQRL